MSFIPLGFLAASGASTKTVFESIASVTVGAGGASTISFSSIPSTYKHLQIRGFAQCNRATYGTDEINIQVGNGAIDTGANYSIHRVFGNGSAPEAGASSSSSYMQIISGSGTGNGNTYAASVIDFLDYSNTNKTKSILALSGVDINGTIAGYPGYIGLSSGNWRSTSAINEIQIVIATGASFNQYSKFSLYGVAQ